MSEREARTPAPGAERRFLRLLGLSLIVIAVLAVAAWAALAVAFPPARVRALVQDQLSRSLRREVSFEGASISLWPPVRLTVSAPALAEPGGFATGTALRARSIHLDLDVLALLTRRLLVRRLELVEPFVHLVLRADGGSNLDGLAAAPPAPGSRQGPPMDLLVREFRVRHGRLQLDDGRAHRRVVLGLDSRLDFSSEAGGSRIGTSGEWRIADLAFGPDTVARLSGLDRRLAGLVWNLAHRGRYEAASRRLTLEKLALEFGRSEIAVTGTVDEPGPRARLDLRARGERLDLGELLGFLAAADLPALRGVRGSGAARFDLAIAGDAGPGGSPGVSGVIAVSNASLRYPGAPLPVDAVSFTARLSPDAVEVGDLRARVGGQSLGASVAARHFADPTVRFAVKGSLELSAVSPLVAPKDARVAGRADLDLAGSGRAKDPGSIALSGRARLAEVSLESKALPRKVEGVSGTVEFSPERAEVRSFTAHAGQSSFVFDGSATRPLALLAKAGKVPPAGLQFRLTSPYLDLGELLPPGPSQPMQFNARGGGDVSIARLRNQKLDVRNVIAKVTVEPNRVEVPSFKLDGYGGVVSGNARFGFEDPAKPSFAVKATADSVKADQFLSAWTPAAGLLTGSMSGSFDLSGAGSEPRQILEGLTAVGLAALKEGRIRGPALDAIAKITGVTAFQNLVFKDMHLPFRVERGRVVTDPVQFSGPSGDWKLTGAVGFDGALDYAVSITLPREVTARLGSPAALAAAGLADDQGRTLIDLAVSGHARAPRVALDTGAMRGRLAGRSSAALAQQREKLAREALEGALGKKFAPDSAGRQPSLESPEVKQAIQKKANELLEGLLGKKRPPAPAGAESAAKDTARR